MSPLVSLLKDLRLALWPSRPAPRVRLPEVRPLPHNIPRRPVTEPGREPLDLGSLARRLVADRHARGQRVRLMVDAGGRDGIPSRRMVVQVLAMRQEIDQWVDHALQHGGVVELVVRGGPSGVRVSVNERRPDGTGLRAELQYPRAA